MESRLDTIGNKTLLTTFNFQPFNLNYEWPPQTTQDVCDSKIKTAILIRLDIYTTCIFPYYKPILNGYKILQANTNIGVIKI